MARSLRFAPIVASVEMTDEESGLVEMTDRGVGLVEMTDEEGGLVEMTDEEGGLVEMTDRGVGLVEMMSESGIPFIIKGIRTLNKKMDKFQYPDLNTRGGGIGGIDID